MDLLSQRNIQEVVGVLKKEVMKTQQKDAVDRVRSWRLRGGRVRPWAPVRANMVSHLDG